MLETPQISGARATLDPADLGGARAVAFVGSLGARRRLEAQRLSGALRLGVGPGPHAGPSPGPTHPAGVGSLGAAGAAGSSGSALPWRKPI